MNESTHNCSRLHGLHKITMHLIPCCHDYPIVLQKREITINRSRKQLKSFYFQPCSGILTSARIVTLNLFDLNVPLPGQRNGAVGLYRQRDRVASLKIHVHVLSAVLATNPANLSRTAGYGQRVGGASAVAVRLSEG